MMSERDISASYFRAKWSKECVAMDKIWTSYKGNLEYSSVSFKMIDVDEKESESQIDKYQIELVPTVLLFKNGKLRHRVVGYHPVELNQKLKAIINEVDLPELPPPRIEGATGGHGDVGNKTPRIEDRLKILIGSHHIMLFMKGDPENPRCGFSKTCIELLNQITKDYGTFDILTDEKVRQGLKSFSNWPTYPQLYVDSELIGGLDVIKELIENDEFADVLKVADAPKDVTGRIKSLINSAKIMLFMKGSPDAPQCKFSRATMEIMSKYKVPFNHYNILADEELRQELKSFSNWPTYPQLYVDGNFIGGLDVMRELDEEGDLASTLQGNQ